MQRQLTLYCVDERVRALEDVYRRRYLGFRNALATVTGSYDTARDAVQEAFARALRDRDSFRGGSIEAWIWRTAVRVALETRRPIPLAPVGELPEAELLEPEQDPALAAALLRLPPRRRLIVFLRYFADLSYGEIAKTCGVSEGTVAATLAQAHDALLRELQTKEQSGHVR
jgi:RNA polymerase sigma factor (sigma-70 family)